MVEYRMTTHYAQCSRCGREYPMYLIDHTQGYAVLLEHGWIKDWDKYLCPDCIGGEE